MRAFGLATNRHATTISEMRKNNVVGELLAQFELQTPKLSKLSFCSSNKVSKVDEWANALLTTQINQTSVLLYKSLPEINLLKTTAENRLAMLEAVRPATQSIITGLTQEFFQQPIATSANAQKIAIIAHSLQKSMIDGYCRCVSDFCQQKKLNTASVNFFGIALHRAITGIGLLVLRSYQMYAQPPRGSWLRLHALFQIAEHFDLLAKPVVDELLIKAQATNIQNAYSRVLMMASGKFNQLNKNDVVQLYEAFEGWSTFLRLQAGNNLKQQNIFAVNLNRDLPPDYIPKIEANEEERVIELNFDYLLSQISREQSESDEVLTSQDRLQLANKIPSPLIEHLSSTWRASRERKQKRKQVQTSADVCIGLVDCHQLIAGGLSFDDFHRMGGLAMDNSPLSMFPQERSSPERKSKRACNSYLVSVKNLSQGGYCLLWKGNVPSRLQAGEFIGIKSMGKRTWSLAVVRWIKQLKDASQLGIQVLISNPIAAGAAQVYDMGGQSDFMRAFLGASGGTNNTLSLVTSAKPFQEYDSLKLYDGDEVYSVKINECLFSSSSVKQFSYQPADGSKGLPGRKHSSKEESSNTFDSSWDEH